MSTPSTETSSNGRPAAPQGTDRYFFSTLDSFGKNQDKLREVDLGSRSSRKALVLASMDAAVKLGPARNSVWAHDVRPGMLRNRDDEHGRLTL